MLGRRCSRCRSFVRTFESETGTKVGCPKCGKRYVVTQVRKRTLTCPRCVKLLQAPAHVGTAVRFRCPHCRVYFRIKPAGKTQLAGDFPILEAPETAPPDPSPPIEEETPYYGEAILVDTGAQERRLRILLVAAGVLLLALLAGGVGWFIWQLPASAGAVRGTVYFGDKPVGTGMIYFFPPAGQPVEAPIAEGGSYEASSIPYGKARIALVVYPPQLRDIANMTIKQRSEFLINWGRRPLTILPPKYADVTTSPLVCTVSQSEMMHDIHMEEEALPPAVKRVPLEED